MSKKRARGSKFFPVSGIYLHREHRNKKNRKKIDNFSNYFKTKLYKKKKENLSTP